MPPRMAKGARGKTAPPIKKENDPTKDPQYLAPKDAALLAQVFQQYEDKKYAASVKTADLVLKKNPNHAQTMAMKGLSTYNMGKREEGREIAKKGLSLEITSHVCWHVNALIHRADREYLEALKCYQQASRVEPNDLNVLRDLINLQLFLRQYSGAAASRMQLLRLQPRLRYSWTALAVAHHLNKDYAKASEYLEAYCEMLDSVPAHDNDYSEVILYRIQVFIEAGQNEKAADLLEKEGKRIVDIKAKKEFSALVNKNLGKTKAAELTYAELVEQNPDEISYLKAYLESRGIDIANIDDNSSRTSALEALQNLSDRFPRSRTIRRAILQVAEGETFSKRVSAYIIDGLTKGIPSLFGDLKALLQDEQKRESILSVASTMKEQMEQGKTIEGDELDSNSEEAPTTYIWLLYLLAQIHLHLNSRATALETIELAIEHTPVLPELWMTKARILKRSGDLLAAEEAMSTARFLDGQDRYLNGKHVKYLLRIDEITKAEETAGLFTRKDAESPLQDLTDMQCLWFLLEEGNSYRRQGNLGMALKRYHNVEKIFAEIYEDEFDFHAYCMRKFTLRACINLARSNDSLRKHPSFLKAARGAIEIYLQLADKPYEKPTTNGKHETNGVSEEERRKAEKKAKKAEAKARAAEEASKKQSGGGKGGQDATEDPAKPVDEDPNGEKLWSNPEPLKALAPFVSQLELLGSNSIESQELVFDVVFKRKEYLRALKALQRLHDLSPASPLLHFRLVRFSLLLQAQPSHLSENVRNLLKVELEKLLPLSSTSLENYNTQYLQKYPGDASVILAASKAQWAISGQKDKEGVANLIAQVARKENDPSLETLQAALNFLRNEVSSESSSTDNFLKSAQELYPGATMLKSSAEIADQRAAIDESRRKEKEAGNEDQN